MKSYSKFFHKIIICQFRYAFQKSVQKISWFIEICLHHILDQVKEKIVCVWTDQVWHLENTKTNRVEFSHATLKNWLENNKDNMWKDRTPRILVLFVEPLSESCVSRRSNGGTAGSRRIRSPITKTRTRA